MYDFVLFVNVKQSSYLSKLKDLVKKCCKLN
jgi:hypothetical protein